MLLLWTFLQMAWLIITTALLLSSWISSFNIFAPYFQCSQVFPLQYRGYILNAPEFLSMFIVKPVTLPGIVCGASIPTAAKNILLKTYLSLSCNCVLLNVVFECNFRFWNLACSNVIVIQYGKQCGCKQKQGS